MLVDVVSKLAATSPLSLQCGHQEKVLARQPNHSSKQATGEGSTSALDGA